MFITAFTTARHLSLSWANSIQYMTQNPTSWRSILILSSHQRLGLSKWYLLQYLFLFVQLLHLKYTCFQSKKDVSNADSWKFSSIFVNYTAETKGSENMELSSHWKYHNYAADNER